MTYATKIEALGIQLKEWKERLATYTYGTPVYLEAVAEINYLRGQIVAYETFLEIPQPLGETFVSTVWHQKSKTSHTANVRIPTNVAKFMGLQKKDRVQVILKKVEGTIPETPIYRKISQHGTYSDKSIRYVLYFDKGECDQLPKDRVIKWIAEWRE